MAKPPKKPKPEEIETEPGAWERFEHAVDAAVKSGPKHRTATGKIVPSKPHKPSTGTRLKTRRRSGESQKPNRRDE